MGVVSGIVGEWCWWDWSAAHHQSHFILDKGEDVRCRSHLSAHCCRFDKEYDRVVIRVSHVIECDPLLAVPLLLLNEDGACEVPVEHIVIT